MENFCKEEDKLTGVCREAQSQMCTGCKKKDTLCTAALPLRRRNKLRQHRPGLKRAGGITFPWQHLLLEGGGEAAAATAGAGGPFKQRPATAFRRVCRAPFFFRPRRGWGAKDATSAAPLERDTTHIQRGGACMTPPRPRPPFCFF